MRDNFAMPDVARAELRVGNLRNAQATELLSSHLKIYRLNPT